MMITGHEAIYQKKKKVPDGHFPLKLRPAGVQHFNILRSIVAETKRC